MAQNDVMQDNLNAMAALTGIGREPNETNLSYLQRVKDRVTQKPPKDLDRLETLLNKRSEEINRQLDNLNAKYSNKTSIK